MNLTCRERSLIGFIFKCNQMLKGWLKNYRENLGCWHTEYSRFIPSLLCCLILAYSPLRKTQCSDWVSVLDPEELALSPHSYNLSHKIVRWGRGEEIAWGFNCGERWEIYWHQLIFRGYIWNDIYFLANVHSANRGNYLNLNLDKHRSDAGWQNVGGVNEISLSVVNYTKK